MTIPNILTVMRLILTPFFAVYLLRETPEGLWIASAIFVVAALTDTADGYLARKMGAETRIGQILDPLADKLLVALAYVSFLVLDLPSVKAWMVGTILGREVLVTAFRTFAGRRGVTILSSPFGKWKTTFQMVLVFVLLALMSYRAMSDPTPAYWKSPGDPFAGHLLYGGLVVTTLITLLSGLDYFWKNRSLLRGSA
ncbi:MAG: CDP-diacylglycerol--glycerol-3-phosphate 3-phosphatidyltransferase [Gemmatimonadetes bacterium]|nr:CDP-diacylglycerol--glycerol-3-phosphate 3-phosphatidyltransferase [Gemmatimonadota bacterium]